MTTPPILQVKDLQIGFKQGEKIIPVVKGVSFDLQKGRLTAIVGESGSGKSVTALSILKLLPPQAAIGGEIIFNNTHPISVFKTNEDEIRSLRGNEMAMIFQEPMTSLNPVFTCGYQVMESLRLHKKLSKEAARKECIALFEQVELPYPEKILNRYPHQVSGGQKQRVMIAMAMSCQPALLIADEPTTALDVRVQKSVLLLIKKLQLQKQMAVLFITHDLGLVNAIADNVIVMQSGAIVEQGLTSQVLEHPRHPYTKALLACRPDEHSKGKRLVTVGDYLNDESSAVAEPLPPSSPGEKIILSVENLTVRFPTKRNLFGKPTEWFKAVDDVSFAVKEKEVLGLVGESGCGKTTLGRTILQLIKPSSGKIILNGTDISLQNDRQLRAIRKDLQIVFQDPYGSLNPRISIGEAILEPLKVHGLFHSLAARKEKVIELLESVSLQPDHFKRYPHEFSGGQRQRICIARALAPAPSFLIFDESVSALDVSVQAQVLNLLNELRTKFEFTSIFISHDLSVVQYISDRIMVMEKGKIIETGDATQIMQQPGHPYTRDLINAMYF
jgi:peptide/nickel transport system ATP-binding protein